MGITTATIDTNLLIDVEEGREAANCVRTLIDLDNQGAVAVQIPAVLAIEKTVDARHVSNLAEFEDFLVRIGFEDPKILPTLARFYMSFLDYAVLASEESLALESRIRECLFPSDSMDPPHNGPAKDLAVWKNHAIDVLIAHTHSVSLNSFLVSRDGNYHQKRDRLNQLGVKSVIGPCELLEQLTNT